MESTVNLAHSLGMAVVAEGVETAAVRDRLAGFGCELAQGFLFSPAVPADEVPFGVLDLARAVPTVPARGQRAGSVSAWSDRWGCPSTRSSGRGRRGSSASGPASAMRAATSVFRVQQILLARFDEVLKPHELTFARYEVLVLLTFSRTGELPLKVIGSRLMVHPTSVTNAIDRLVAAGLRRRRPEPGRRARRAGRHHRRAAARSSRRPRRR